MKNPYNPFPSNGGMYTLTNIESLPLVNGVNYKHYFLSPSPGNTNSTWDAVWIEGVGSLSLITAPGGAPDFDQVGELSCAFRNGDSFYANLERIGSCEAELSIDEVAVSKNLILYPNPTSDCFSLISEVQDLEIAIIDITGKVILRFKNQPRNSIASLKKGVYFVKLKNSDQTFFTKIIKN